jgi:hypothetical protein
MEQHMDNVLELARFEREAREAVRLKIASRQLGEAWKGIENETACDLSGVTFIRVG